MSDVSALVTLSALVTCSIVEVHSDVTRVASSGDETPDSPAHQLRQVRESLRHGVAVDASLEIRRIDVGDPHRGVGTDDRHGVDRAQEELRTALPRAVCQSGKSRWPAHVCASAPVTV